MKIFIVFASACLATASAGISGFGGFQSNNGGAANDGYSDQSSSGGYDSGSSRGASSGLSLFGNSGGLGSGGFGGGISSGSSFGGVGATRNAGAGLGNFQSEGNNGVNQQGGQVRRFVSVHVAPEESVSSEPRIIRAGGQPDTHYNIIFVKAPSASSQQKTEVILPEQNQQKTLVYVLIRKNEAENNVQIRAPAPTKPSKPEVFFIRYQNQNQPGIGGDAGNLSGGNSNNLSNNGFGLSSGGNIDSSYGPPSQQNGGGSNGGYQ